MTRRRHGKAPPPLHPLAPQLTTYDLQLASPLFHAIPPELRAEIFLFALAPYPDTSAPAVPYDTFGFRPEHAHPLIQAVALLRTCRRIYLETHTRPAALRTFTSWRQVWCERAPAGVPADPGLKRLTPTQLVHAHRYRIVAQQSYLEFPAWAQVSLGGQRALGRYVRVLTITLRHTDMWGWADTDGTDPLRMHETGDYGAEWRRGFLVFPALEELRIELEIVEWRKDEMEALVEHVREWRIPIGQGRELSAEGIPVRTETWISSAKIPGGQHALDGADTLVYRVFTIRWKAVRQLVLEEVEGLDRERALRDATAVTQVVGESIVDGEQTIGLRALEFLRLQ